MPVSKTTDPPLIVKTAPSEKTVFPESMDALSIAASTPFPSFIPETVVPKKLADPPLSVTSEMVAELVFRWPPVSTKG